MGGGNDRGSSLTHSNTATVTGTWQGGGSALARASWHTVLHPDPSAEPDLEISLTPHLTHF